MHMRRTRCMCDVYATYLWRLHDDCAAYCYTPIIKLIRHSIESDSLWIRKERHTCRCALTTLYTPNGRCICNYKARHSIETYVAVTCTLHDRLVRLDHHEYGTASKAYVAVTLYDRLDREGSQKRGDV